MGGPVLSQHRFRYLLRRLLMRYNVWLLKEDGRPSMGPSQITASGLVEAQRLALATLQDLQSDGALIDWTIQTVTEAY
jgi:hypothetical protein